LNENGYTATRCFPFAAARPVQEAEARERSDHRRLHLYVDIRMDMAGLQRKWEYLTC
jgi:hypothetical protein